MASLSLRNLLRRSSGLQAKTSSRTHLRHLSRRNIFAAGGGLGASLLLSAPRPRMMLSARAYSEEGGSAIWDDSDWMKHGDSNAEAYEELDITKLRPFPEFRNVATGPVWGPNAFGRVWNTYYDTQAPKKVVAEQIDEWKRFQDEYGLSPVEYFESEDFKDRYGDKLIWTSFKRNHKGAVPPRRTRYYCFSFGKTGNPCPLCRDERILINFRNLPLLQNFIDPSSGETYSTSRTGVCRKKQGHLDKAIWLARDQGFLMKPVNSIPSHGLNLYQCNHPAVSPK